MTATDDLSAPNAEAPPTDLGTRPSRVRRVALIVGCGLIAAVALAVAALSLISSGKVAYRPGSAIEAESRLHIQGAPTYDPEGDVLFLTVAVDRLSLLEWFFVRRDHNSLIVPSSVAFPKGHDADRAENAVRMIRSKSDAELLALTRLGYDVYQLTGATVTRVADGPSTNVLRAGDTITAMDSYPINSVASLTARLRTTVPGALVEVRLEQNDGSSRTERIALGTRPDGQSHGYLGVELRDRVTEKSSLPVDIDIDSGRIGGDSAGLAFTLSILDDLTAGELTGGKRVAVTGTIDIDGDVGAIGGVEQKVVAARRAHADIMLVPEDNYAAASAKAAGRLQVVAVSTLDQALEVLRSLGGNVAELPRAGARG